MTYVAGEAYPYLGLWVRRLPELAIFSITGKESLFLAVKAQNLKLFFWVTRTIFLAGLGYPEDQSSRDVTIFIYQIASIKTHTKKMVLLIFF